MESFHWDQHFVTGLPEVDQQHQRLVDIINKLGDHLVEEDLQCADSEALFTDLFDYADYHFREEENMMSNVGIDRRHLEGHIIAHQSFLREISLAQATITPENTSDARNIHGFLVHWLAYHILGTDQNMGKQVRAIQSGISPSRAYTSMEESTDNATEPLLEALQGLFRIVSERNAELISLNGALEQKVAERTKALVDANTRLEELALTDILTGLPNRRHAMRQFTLLWNESLETHSPLGCIMIDADNFKEVNDTYGHDCGDSVLCQLAQTLHDELRTDDFVCRLGGDEFLAICPNTDLQGGVHIAELLCRTVSALRVPTGDGAWVGSISVGVAARSAGILSRDALIKQADDAVYAAKRDGKNCVRTAAATGES